MKQIPEACLLAFALFALSACSNENPGGGTGGGGVSSGGGGVAGSTSGAAGASGGKAGVAGSSGSASTAGNGGSGVAGSAGAGGSSGGAPATGAMCSPGTTIEAVFAYPMPLQNCGFEGKGELAGVEAFYRSIKLPAPIGPGDVFSFSVGLDDLGQGSMELWGGTAECGEAHEKFDSAEIPAGGEPEGIRCLTAKPQTGTYPYLIWVLKSAGGHGDVTLCPGVECGGK